MSVLGVGVITYERRGLLEQLFASLAELTESPHELVVADDGSRDGTVEWCRDRGLRVVSGVRRGVAWNKNRALFALAHLGCDPLVLLEDDAYPVVHGWERDWIEGTRRWHHLGYHHAKVAKHTVSGTGTPADPFVNPAATAQCLSVSAEVVVKVGFFDPRFRGWGHEHAEWTTRIKTAGYGFRRITLPDGRRPEAQLYLTGGLGGGDASSFRDEDQVRANLEVGNRIAGEPVFRRPWRTPEERASFLAEQAEAGIDGAGLAAQLDAYDPA
ncbi:MAG TPA: glycosyltransferase [Solirubrobacteraceae bacterium]